MLATTPAIVLRTIRHGDNSTILKAYTRRHGLRSYIVRTGGKGARAAMLGPLNRLEIVAREDTDRDLTHVREMRVRSPYTRVPFEPRRGALALFVQEVLYKVLKEGAPDAPLYDFVEHSLELMDTRDDLRYFPLVFLLRLTEYLGFLPEAPDHGEDRFDMREGHFIHHDAPHGHTMGPPLSLALAALLRSDPQDEVPMSIPLEQRRQLLDHLLLYYRLHIDGLGELRSPAVLHQVLS